MDTVASTASLSFEPTQITVTPNNTFEVIVNIFTDTQSAISTDAWIHYDPSFIQPILPVKTPGLFETTEAKIISPGTLYVYGLHRDPMTAGPANGTIATLTFKSLKEGSTKLLFECPSYGEPRSQIIKNSENLENIINCERTTGHTSTISISNPQVLGAADVMGSSLHMWYLTIAVAVLTLTTILYIRFKNANRHLTQ